MRIMDTSRKTIFHVKLIGGALKCTATWEDSSLVHLDLERAKHFVEDGDENDSRIIQDIIDGIKNPYSAPIRMDGTEFQKRVWTKAMDIPYGTTITYEELGRRMQCRSPRAVGQALKKNPLPVIVSCHRVVGKDGSLTGFSCGLDIKKLLLQHEGANSNEACNSIRHP
jgi:O-6-methylguanine DNA methyltransferase